MKGENIMKKRIIASLLAVFVLSSHCNISSSALAETPIGYGQGKMLDSMNRPSDAVSFGEKYSKYNAYAVTPKEEQIIITFDQGYENGYTASILDTLKEKGTTAIFFLTGDYAKSENELIRRMINEGHVLGNHGMTHKSIPSLDEQEAVNEIISLQEYVKEVYNYDMQYFRFPCGQYSEKALELVYNLGLKPVFWSYAYVDWETQSQPDPDESLDCLIEAAHSGEILLLHSVSSTNAKILGDMIDGFREKGFRV